MKLRQAVLSRQIIPVQQPTSQPIVQPQSSQSLYRFETVDGIV